MFKEALAKSLNCWCLFHPNRTKTFEYFL